jgi:general secretion pathway protein F
LKCGWVVKNLHIFVILFKTKFKTMIIHMATQSTLPLRIRAELFTQLAQMEIAGLPTDKAFAILNLPPTAQPRLLAARKLLQGADPASAGERAGLFTKLEAKLIRASLMAGSPARIYQRLGEVYTQRAMQHSAMKSRLALAVFMLFASFIITPLPGLIINDYGLLAYIWLVLKPILMITGAFYVVRWLLRLPNAADTLIKLPIAGNMIVQRNSRDFFESLALMLDAGVSMLDALPLAVDTIQASLVKRDFAKIIPKISKGATLSQAIANCQYIGGKQSRERAIGFITTGEASGTLPEMLQRHVDFESSAINTQAEALSTWIPRLIYGFVVVWMAIGILGGQGITPQMPADL